MSTKLKHQVMSKDKVFGHVSEQYAPVNTQLFLEPFTRRGWSPIRTKTITSKTGKVSKEIVTLRNPAYFTSHGPVELTVINSYDARSSLKIVAGIGRLVCSNGLMMMIEGEQFKFVHRGNAIYEKLDNAYDKIVAYLDTVRQRIDRLESTILDTSQVRSIINNIAKRVYETDTKTKKVEVTNVSDYTVRQLTRVRRQADSGLDAFTVLNIIQENITRYGRLNAMVKETNKETSQVEFITRSTNRTEGKGLTDIKMNQLITEEFLKAVA